MSSQKEDNDGSYPSYLNEQLLLKSLENLEKCDEIKIWSFKITKATNSGDNYLSEVFRIKVNYCIDGTDKDVSFIVKCIESSVKRNKIIESMNAFDKECLMFFEILPEISKIAGEKFSAEAFYATEDPVKLIIFQDLRVLGYRLADRVCGLDLKHCEVIFEKIGRFHAASMVYAQRNHKSLRPFTFNFFNPDDKNDTVLEMFNGAFSTLIEVIATDQDWKTFDTKIVQKLLDLKPRFKQKLGECLNQLSDDFLKVLNHGDLWINNIMFKYSDDNVPIDAIFVDFQLSFYSSSGIDLNYCINTCPMSEIRENFTDSLIQKYHDSLTKMLIKLNYSKRAPELFEILSEVEKYNFHGLAAAIFILPIVSLDREACQDLKPSASEMLDKDNSKKILQKSFKGRYFQESIKPILTRYYNMGILD